MRKMNKYKKLHKGRFNPYVEFFISHEKLQKTILAKIAWLEQIMELDSFRDMLANYFSKLES